MVDSFIWIKISIRKCLSVGDFVAFNGYIGLFEKPISWIPSLIAKYKRAQISYKRLEKVF